MFARFSGKKSNGQEIDENGIPIDPADDPEDFDGLEEDDSDLLSNYEMKVSTEHQPTRFEDITFEDDDRDITYGRRIARFLTEHGYTWYNPRAAANDTNHCEDEAAAHNDNHQPVDDNNLHHNCGPKLDSAWAYFEHIALPRKLHSSARYSDKINSYKADPGEHTLRTELYPYLTTPEDQLGDFGIGVGIYFLCMRVFSIICFIAGLLYIPVIHFYRSNDYSEGEDSANSNSWVLRGSAICTDTMWVPCPGCGNHEDDFDATRLANGTLQSDPNTVVYFALRNLCEGANWEQGVNHLCVAAFMFISICVLSWLLLKGELKFDEDNLTASDYSVRVLDPPEDAIDPDEWERYFSGHFGSKVVYCTVALNNEKLIKALSRRRTVIQAITYLLPADLKVKNKYEILDDDEELETVAASLVADSPPSPLWQRCLHPFGLFQDAVMLKDKFDEVNAEIEELLKVKYKATNVFVTFEHEEEQRTVLHSLSVGKYYSFFNIAGTTDFPFRDDKVLRVEEAAEPEAIRWINGLDATLTLRVGQFLLTFIPLIGLLFACGYIVKEVRESSGVFWSGIMISVFNSIIPIAVRSINNNLEKHDNEGYAQASLYFKITIFRWSNTALLTTFLTDFTETIADEALVGSILAVFIAEIFTAPLIQLLDPVNQFKRHLKAPRAKNQIAMNNCFTGTFYNIAERYTNMTKIVFLCGWYAVIFPAGYFFGAAALVVQYYADKFCLLRTWHIQPPIGAEISVIGRRYFFPVMLVIMSVIGSYYWAGFPFDNLCIANVTSTTATGNYNLTLVSNGALVGSKEWMPDEDGNNSYDYKYCNQNYLSNPKNGEMAFEKFPAVGVENDRQYGNRNDDGWMSDDQYRVSKFYGWGSVAAMAFVFFVFFRFIVVYVRSLFQATWTDGGERDSEESYSDQKSISCYIPQMKNKNFEYPLIACDIAVIEKKHISWEDPVKPFSTYSLARDIKHIENLAKEQGREFDESNIVLAPIKHWPPKKKSKRRLKVKSVLKAVTE